MKTTDTCTLLVLLSLFFGAKAAHAYYSPTAGRWLSRDPVEERGFRLAILDSSRAKTQTARQEASLYHFVANSPVSRVDLWGLSCKDPCEWARRHAEGTDVGLTVCCGGKKYACLIFSGGAVGTSSPKARSIIDACVMVHEQVHVDDPNYICPKCLWNRTTFGDWASPAPATQIAGERAAYLKGIECLQSSKSECGGDSVCDAAIDAEIAFLLKKVAHDY
jgi:hypothetical protein